MNNKYNQERSNYTEESNTKLRDMDMFLKEKLVDIWDKAITLSIEGDYQKCFNAYKSLFRFIQGYNFTSKKYLEELVKTTDEYLANLNGRTLNLKAQIQFNKNMIVFRDLIDLFMTELPKAYIELDLWFRSIPESQDIDVDFSKETFGDELTQINSKTKQLLTLEKKVIVDLMTINHIHELYAKGVRINVL